MIVMNLFTIVIEKESTRDPALYYNHVTKQWCEDFQLGCGFTSQKEAISVISKMDVDGAYILEGSTTLE